MQTDLTPPLQPPEVPLSDKEARRLRETIRSLVAETASRETLRNPEDVERLALELLSRDPASERSRMSGEDERQAYRDTYTGVIDRALLEEILTQHYSPELREIFSGDGLSALRLVIQTTAAFFAQNSAASPSDLKEISHRAAQEVEGYLRNEVYPSYPRPAGFYHDFYKALVEPEIRQIIARETAGFV